MADPIVSCAALVLGAAVRADGTPSPSLRRRALHAVDLWQDGRVELIVATGGRHHAGPTEADVIADVCLGKGIPHEALRLERAALTTEDNLRLSLPLLKDVGHVIIVTDRHHAPRAMLVARRLGLRVSSDGPPPGLPLFRRSRALLREALALTWYFLRGAGR